MNRKCTIPVVPFRDWTVADREAWDAALHDGDILDEPGPFAGFSGHRISSMYRAYGRWLGFLGEQVVRTGTGHLTPENIRSYIEILRAVLASRSVVTYVEDLAYAVRGMAPEIDVTFIQAATRRLRETTRSTRNKRARLRPIQDLLELGLDLMRAATDVGGDVQPAITFRDGLLIALLAARPMRARNITSIEIGRHLVVRGEEHWLEFPAEEVKNRRALEFPLPEALTEPLAIYMEQHRPVLLSQRGSRTVPQNLLWYTRLGTPLSTNRLWVTITKRTQERFGHTINPHLFRDAVATAVAIDDPAHVRMTARILGHASMSAAERHYNQATSIEAARRMQAVLEGLRNEVKDDCR